MIHRLPLCYMFLLLLSKEQFLNLLSIHCRYCGNRTNETQTFVFSSSNSILRFHSSNNPVGKGFYISVSFDTGENGYIHISYQLVYA